jgi:hypothetical protein
MAIRTGGDKVGLRTVIRRRRDENQVFWNSKKFFAQIFNIDNRILGYARV